MEDTKTPAQTDSMTVPSQPVKEPSKRTRGHKLSDWQRFFLSRLEYLAQQQRLGAAQDDVQRTLLSKAIYSTYLDCQLQGVGDNALQIITPADTKPSAN